MEIQEAGRPDKHILILGAGVMQGPAIDAAKAMGWRCSVVDGDPLAPLRDRADCFAHIDLKDVEGITAFARRLKESRGLDGVFTAGTDFSLSVAQVAEALGLPGIPVEAARNASDKARMRACFDRASVPSPRFVTVDSPDSIHQPLARGTLSFPLVVKPVDSMGARGCRRVEGLRALEEAITDALRYSRSGKAIVEEFIDGPEYSIDALVVDGKIHICGVADRHIYYPPYFIEMGHTLPARLSADALEEMIEVFSRGVRALGITSGAAKGDVKRSAKGPVIGEIAARLSGGYMSGWTYPLASGVPLTKAALEIAIGCAPSSLVPRWQRSAAERAFISIPGRIRSVEGTAAVRALPGVDSLFVRVKSGDEVDFPVNNVSKAGNVIAVADDGDTAIACAERAAAAIEIVLSVPDSRTEAFLEGPLDSESFPPPAFSLPGSVAAALDCGSLPKLTDLFESSHPVRDWQGRTPREALDLVARHAGCALDESGGPHTPPPAFWRAFFRGSWQGGLYWLEREGPSGRRR